MILKTKVICSSSFVPYHNLALEEYLLDTVEKDTVILYLWQNAKTVVIGQNQNAWQECRVRELTEDGGLLARRLSGGGAVFHDLGNLNFTFLVPRSEYDVRKQCSVISRAASYYNIDAVLTGRNDILAEGKKFSGNAFYKHKDNAYHHGTILISSDMTMLSKYLNVSKAKLESKGVKSVEARVCNLCDLCPDVTVEDMKVKLIKALEEVYGIKPQILKEEDCDSEKIEKLEAKYSSWDWKYGRKIPFNAKFQKKFSWGEVSIELNVEKGIINEAVCYSDAMDSFFIKKISQALKGRRYSYSDIKSALDEITFDSELDYEAGPGLIEDLDLLFKEQNF